MSSFRLLIYAGCFAATLSTALTNLLSVPRLIQALGIDHVYPGLIFFSKGYGKSGEPYRGYVLTFFISSSFVIIGQLKYFLLYVRSNPLKLQTNYKWFGFCYSWSECDCSINIQLLPRFVCINKLLYIPCCLNKTPWLATYFQGNNLFDY